MGEKNAAKVEYGMVSLVGGEEALAFAEEDVGALIRPLSLSGEEQKIVALCARRRWVAHRNHGPKFKTVCKFQLRAEPNHVSKLFRFVEGEGRDAGKRKPIIFSASYNFENRTESLVGVGEPFEGLLANCSADSWGLVERLERKLLCRCDVAFCVLGQGFDR